MDEYEAEQSTTEEMRSGIATASMDVMDAVDGPQAEAVLELYNNARRAMEALVEGGLQPTHAGQVIVGLVAGATLNAITDLHA